MPDETFEKAVIELHNMVAAIYCAGMWKAGDHTQLIHDGLFSPDEPHRPTMKLMQRANALASDGLKLWMKRSNLLPKDPNETHLGS